MEDFCSCNYFELKLFDTGAFLQYTAYFIILHFRNIDFSANRVRNDFESKQR